jgi:hypothetical protein
MARNNIKYCKLEEAGVELFGPTEHIPLAQDVGFTAVGYTSDNVQEALVEGSSLALSTPMLTLQYTCNGTVGSSAWIAPTELLSNPRVVIPRKIRILDITWSNNNTSLGAFTFGLYKNGQLAGNLVYTYTASAADRTNGYGYHNLVSAIDFAVGDLLYIKNTRPSGTALSDLSLILWIQRLP